MTKVVVTIELDNEAYDKKHGPSSEYWEKYNHGREYKSLEGEALKDMIVEILREGFYDWASKEWLRLTLDGKVSCEGCGKTEGHKDWCHIVAGPEAA